MITRFLGSIAHVEDDSNINMHAIIINNIGVIIRWSNPILLLLLNFYDDVESYNN